MIFIALSIHLVFSQNLCLQSSLGGILTSRNSSLGFYVEGADCYQGQIGWPVITEEVFTWIWLNIRKPHSVCGYSENDESSFPWFTYLNLTLQLSGHCLAAYVQNDTFPLITSVRCLRQCLQLTHSNEEGCGDSNSAELCAAKNITERLLARASPWRRCLVAHLASPEQKVVLFEQVEVSVLRE